MLSSGFEAPHSFPYSRQPQAAFSRQPSPAEPSADFVTVQGLESPSATSSFVDLALPPFCILTLRVRLPGHEIGDEHEVPVTSVNDAEMTH